MKHPNDKKLSDLLKRKAAELETGDSDAGHLWSDIEQALPKEQKAPFFFRVTALLSIAVATYIFIGSGDDEVSVTTSNAVKTDVTASDVKKSSHDQPDERIRSIEQEKNVVIDDRNTSTVSVPIEESGRNALEANRESSYRGSNDIKKAESDYNTIVQEGEKSMYDVENKGITVEYAPIIEQDEMFPLKLTVDSLDDSHKELSKFWYAETAVSFHTLDPNQLDEVLVRTDEERNVPFSDRLSISLGYGMQFPLGKRFTFTPSVGLTYSRSALNFVTYGNSRNEITFVNNRMDFNLGTGIEYKNKSYLAENEYLILQFDSRVKLFDFRSNDNLGYKPFFLLYRVSYLFELKQTLVGPFYSSAIAPMEVGALGSIKPNIFGVTLRRKIN